MAETNPPPAAKPDDLKPDAVGSLAPFCSKFAVQLSMRAIPSPPTSKVVTVPSFVKKNGVRVGAHTRHVALKKPAASKKTNSTRAKVPHPHRPMMGSSSYFRKQGVPGRSQFQAPDDCQASLSLARSLYIEELQYLVKGRR
jgi:hypothetical protein